MVVRGGGDDDNEEKSVGVEYVKGCPGCKLDAEKAANAGIPYLNFGFVFIAVLAASLPISSLYPFLYYMVRDFQIAKNESHIGYYAGIVGSAYMIGRAFSSIPWGIAADRYGRKPVIICGSISVVIFNTLFGFSSKFWIAVTTRFFLGSLCGVIGSAKAYAMEISRKEHEAMGISLVSTSWGLGLVLGPAIGGFLAQPAEKYPNIVSKGSVFGRFPYALPCLVISIVAFVTAIACFWLPESLHNHPEYIKSEQKMTSIQNALNKHAQETILDKRFSSARTTPLPQDQEIKTNESTTATKRTSEAQYEDNEQDKQTTLRKSIELHKVNEGVTITISTDETHKVQKEKKGSTSQLSLLKNWPLMSSILVYCIFQLHDIAYSEVFSLWAVSPSYLGGLGFTTSRVGIVLAITGAGLLAYQLFFYNLVESRFGPLAIARTGAILSLPLLATFPAIATLSGVLLVALLTCSSTLKNILSRGIITGLTILQNRAVSQNQRGAANGIAMAAQSAFKAFGPALGGALLSWAESRQHASFLPGSQMLFFLLGVIELIGLVMTFKPILALPPES
ncbi:unnamed protein product [Rhodiola kirilowii]